MMKQTWQCMDLPALMVAQKLLSVCLDYPMSPCTGGPGVCVSSVISVIISLSLLYYTDRHPKKVSPWLNLVKLLTPTSWAWTLASLISVGLCFNVTSLMIKRWMGMRLMTIHIDLCPFRCFSIVGCFKSAVCFQCIFSLHL